MSIAGFPEADDRFYRKSTHRRNDSGELDVFEATRYFSGGTEKSVREERQAWGGRRMSLDVPTMMNSLPSQSHRIDKQIKEKKYKQPRSPGGRLASFLNSLFHQAASKKKKSKSSMQSMKDEEESPGGRRRRRSSISHFQSVGSADMKSIYSSSSSGFRTPPPYVNTPTKGYKDIRSYSDNRQFVSMSRCSGQVKSNMGPDQEDTLNEKRNMDLTWLDEKFKFIDVENKNVFGKDKIWVNKFSSEKYVKKVEEEMDDGGDSDSSSDLFELQNYDLGVYSSGLPVYETTHMESIKRGAPIAINGPV